jgi:predicted enzyme related to lactoylglutathione lyase
MTQKVNGIGGVFFKAHDMALMRDWYSRNLGISFDSGFNGTVFSWPAGQTPDRPGSTVWSLFSADTEYFAPSQAAFMINFRVDDLDAMLAQLRANGCSVDDRVEVMEGIGRFGWVMDPEQNRIELWEPAIGA